MEYVIFEVLNGIMIRSNYGTISAKDIHEAKRKLRSQAILRGKTFYLVKSDEFKRVVI